MFPSCQAGRSRRLGKRFLSLSFFAPRRSPARSHRCPGRLGPSIGVRPEPKLLLAGRPKSSKAMGFDDQEPADQGPCDHEDQERHGSLDRNMDAQGMRHLIEVQDRQHSVMKAAPRNEPRIEPSPPMMTMNRTWNERSMLKASGSQGAEIDECPQRARDTDDEGRQRKGRRGLAYSGRRMPTGLGGDVHYRGSPSTAARCCRARDSSPAARIRRRTTDRADTSRLVCWRKSVEEVQFRGRHHRSRSRYSW